jgi:hypothetical protein
MIAPFVQPRHGPQVHVGRVVVGRERPLPARHGLTQWRVRVELEQVEGGVLRREVRQPVDRGLPGRHGLPGQPEHQVEAQVRHAGRADGGNRLACARRIVRAPQPREFLVVERLDTEAHARDAGVAELRHPLGRDRLRIRLEGHLCVRCHGEAPAAGRNEARDLGRLEQRWCAAAEEDRVGGRSVRRSPDLVLERTHVPCFQRRIEQPAVEIAVAADRGAERDVEIQAERHW